MLQFLSSAAVRQLIILFVLWVLVIAAVIVDLWDGVYTAHRLKRPVQSHKLRKTIDKISEYWRLLLLGAAMDCIGLLLPFYTLPYLSMALSLGLICVEAKSMFEHASMRRSSTLELQKVLRAAIDCASEADAIRLLKQISTYISSQK